MCLLVCEFALNDVAQDQHHQLRHHRPAPMHPADYGNSAPLSSTSRLSHNASRQSAGQRFVVSVGQPMTVQNGRAKPQTPNSYLASFRERPGSAVARPDRGPDPQMSGSLYPPESCGGSTALEETSEPAILMVHQEEADAPANLPSRARWFPQ